MVATGDRVTQPDKQRGVAWLLYGVQNVLWSDMGFLSLSLFFYTLLPFLGVQVEILLTLRMFSEAQLTLLITNKTVCMG